MGMFFLSGMQYARPPQIDTVALWVRASVNGDVTSSVVDEGITGSMKREEEQNRFQEEI